MTRKIPYRMCVGCRIHRAKRELIRVVRTPEGTLLLDPTGKKAGRGAYICPQRECFQKALKNRALERALGVDVSPDLQREIEETLIKMGVD
ncbi:MAG: uncharacterized protein PWP65_252 [Clostridia bacterium]|nr:uncharacterized protein [Clostridia bacterium]